jgi:hypothetical protein
VSPRPCQRRSHRAHHAIPTSILVVHALLLARRHSEEQLLDAAIIPVVGSFLSSSTAVACWVTDGEMALRFGMNVSSKGCCLAPFAGFVLLITFRKYVGQLYSRAPCSVLHTDYPSSVEHDILSAEEETPAQLGARLHLMSNDMCGLPLMIAMPLGPRARGRSPPATTIVNKRPLGFSLRH